MPLEPSELRSAIEHAVQRYAYRSMGQAWLKPTTVLTIDQLVPRLLPRDEARTPFLCVNGMDSRRSGAAWAWRRELYDNENGLHLKNMKLYRHECLVDMNLMVGEDDPYQTILTAESEGYAANGRTLDQVAQATNNDFLWDFYKLLCVPSPVRVFFTLCSSKYQPALQRRLDQLVRRYSSLPELLPPGTDLWSVSFPTGSMETTDIQVLHWAPDRHGNAAVDHSFRAL